MTRSSVIYYSTDARKSEIYLLNLQHIQATLFSLAFVIRFLRTRLVSEILKAKKDKETTHPPSLMFKNPDVTRRVKFFKKQLANMFTTEIQLDSHLYTVLLT